MLATVEYPSVTRIVQLLQMRRRRGISNLAKRQNPFRPLLLVSSLVYAIQANVSLTRRHRSVSKRVLPLVAYFPPLLAFLREETARATRSDADSSISSSKFCSSHMDRHLRLANVRWCRGGIHGRNRLVTASCSNGTKKLRP